MSKKIVASVVLIVIAFILHVTVTILGFEEAVDTSTAEGASFALGATLSGIVVTAIPSLIIALLITLFSKQKSRSNFFFYFSTMLVLSTLVVVLGSI